MNLQTVFECFVLLSGLDAKEAAEWLPLCEHACEGIRKRLKTEADISESSASLNTAAAATAFYQFCLIRASRNEPVGFNAGDVRISKESQDKVTATAEKLLLNALTPIISLLRDDAFYFGEAV